jgi:hypothetical protein
MAWRGLWGNGRGPPRGSEGRLTAQLSSAFLGGNSEWTTYASLLLLRGYGIATRLDRSFRAPRIDDRPDLALKGRVVTKAVGRRSGRTI